MVIVWIVLDKALFLKENMTFKFAKKYFSDYWIHLLEAALKEPSLHKTPINSKLYSVILPWFTECIQFYNKIRTLIKEKNTLYENFRKKRNSIEKTT